ncbi:hypothetical protein A2U01_0090755, partial [Trifolium medium]|nr:hypothetical protein [Trifolium medium]
CENLVFISAHNCDFATV